ncbi:hypothetical protein ACKGJN_11275 [Gillisia sp. Q332]|uniref:hypothetical protein n=1 Tax=Gillisia xinjiangensis TaxID=3384765 RepID=UPI0039197013
MDLIHYNPYRTAGVYSNATTKEIQKNKSKITSYANIGKDLRFGTDFNFLRVLKRDTPTADKAFAQLQQNQDKLKHSLFWFINSGSFDSTALEYLENGNKEKAIEIWKKVTDGKEVTAKNFSYFSNLGTLNLASSFLSEIQVGIAAKVKLIESGNFPLFAQLVTDDTYLIDQKLQSKQFIDEILLQFQQKYSGSEAISLFSLCNGSIQKYLTGKLAEEPLHFINNKIETTKRKRKLDEKESYQYGLLLYRTTKTTITELKKIIGVNDLRFKSSADSLSKEILQCGIDYFQEYKAITDPSTKSLELIKYAGFMAVGSQIKERIHDNKKTIEDWAQTAAIQEEIKFITTELSEFQNKTDTTNNAQQLIHNCKPKLLTIKNKLGATDEFYLNISSAVANNAQGMLVAAVNSAQEKLGSSNSYDSKILIILKLKQILQEALAVSNSIGSLDMNPELRSRYNGNHSTLKSLASQIGDSGSPTPRPTPPPVRTTGRQNTGSNNSTKTVETFSANEGIPPFVYIIGVIILFLILANACS